MKFQLSAVSMIRGSNSRFVGLPYYDLFPVYNTQIACMQVCSKIYLMENTNRVQQGVSKVSLPACSYYDNVVSTS